MRHSVLRTFAATTLALAASYASADTVQLDGFTFAPASPLTINLPSPETVTAGQFNGTLNGSSFTTYCSDLFQGAAFGVLYTDYSVVDGLTAWGAPRSTALDQAFSLFAATGWPTNAAQSAAAQAVVWEILNETGPTYDFTSGAFTASSTDAATQALLNSFDWAGLASVNVTYHANQLYSPTTQDFVLLTPVPEPSTYAMMIVGMVGMGFVARRRSRQV